ncbi:hypothetical protein [Solidesulfovibrio alcoholivorans]|uniref:hypothetical protein n=1 Tax=Solidesulfovibrio alcoholivorans TaxID=81406 RepID=UPI000A6F52A3|nr:hypothetical protein [Solidesulfovibrio alcoholivorans]
MQSFKHISFLLNKEEYDNAYNYLDKAIELPSSATHSSNGSTQNEKSIYALSSFFITNAASNNNGEETRIYAEIHRQLGVALNRLGDIEKSANHFQLSFIFNNKQPVYLFDILGNYYLHNGNNEECLRLLASGLEFYPDHPLILRLAGTAEIRSSNNEMAFHYFYNSIKVDRKQPAWVYLSLLKSTELSPQNLDILASDTIISHELEKTLNTLRLLFITKSCSSHNQHKFDSIKSLHTPILFLLKLYIAKYVKYIDIKHATDHDIDNLKSLGISGYFLKLFSKGPSKVLQYILDAYDFDASKLLTDPICDRMSEAFYILKTHEKPVLCPFSGCATSTKKSIGFETFLYCNELNSCLILQNSHALFAVCDSAYFFIDHNIMLFDGKITCYEKLQEVLLKLLYNTLSNIQNVYDHLVFNSDNQPIATIEPLFPHLGHALYNVYSAYGTLFDVSCFHNIEYYVTYNKTNWFGFIGDLYKNEFFFSKNVRVNDENEIFDFIVNNHAMPIFIKDNYIRASLSRKIVDHSIATCSLEFLEKARQVRHTAWPLILLTLRLGNRSWISQCSGFIDLIINLQKHYPRIHFIIDGMTDSTNNAYGWTHHWMSMDNELEMAAKILENTPPGIVHNGVGCKMHESITWCHFCDAFIAPMGSGMTKYKWVANKPGVAYANTATLSIPGKHELNVWDYNREGIIPAIYVPRESIIYDEEHTSLIKNRSNYDMDWEFIYETFRNLLTKIGFK